MEATTFIGNEYTRLCARFHASTIERHEVRWVAVCYARWEALKVVAYLATVQSGRNAHG